MFEKSEASPLKVGKIGSNKSVYFASLLYFSSDYKKFLASYPKIWKLFVTLEINNKVEKPRVVVFVIETAI